METSGQNNLADVGDSTFGVCSDVFVDVVAELKQANVTAAKFSNLRRI